MRKAKPKKRVILPDPVYNDQKVSKFVNHLMYDGKKNTSYQIFYHALDVVKAKMSNEEKSALEIWKSALDNITPQVEVKSRRIGGYVPGAHGNPSRAQGEHLHEEHDCLRTQAQWKVDGREARRRDNGRFQQPGRSLQAQGRHAPYGRG